MTTLATYRDLRDTRLEYFCDVLSSLNCTLFFSASLKNYTFLLNLNFVMSADVRVSELSQKPSFAHANRRDVNDVSVVFDKAPLPDAFR